MSYNEFMTKVITIHGYHKLVFFIFLFVYTCFTSFIKETKRLCKCESHTHKNWKFIVFLFYFTLIGASNVKHLFYETYYFQERLGVKKKEKKEKNGNEVFVTTKHVPWITFYEFLAAWISKWWRLVNNIY